MKSRPFTVRGPAPVPMPYRAETCLAHAHKRLKRGGDHGLQRIAVATTQLNTSEKLNASKNDKPVEGRPLVDTQPAYTGLSFCNHQSDGFS